MWPNLRRDRRGCCDQSHHPLPAPVLSQDLPQWVCCSSSQGLFHQLMSLAIHKYTVLKNECNYSPSLSFCPSSLSILQTVWQLEPVHPQQGGSRWCSCLSVWANTPFELFPETQCLERCQSGALDCPPAAGVTACVFVCGWTRWRNGDERQHTHAEWKVIDSGSSNLPLNCSTDVDRVTVGEYMKAEPRWIDVCVGPVRGIWHDIEPFFRKVLVLFLRTIELYIRCNLDRNGRTDFPYSKNNGLLAKMFCWSNSIVFFAPLCSTYS